MHIVVPSMPVMAVGMSAAGLLRAKGDAKRSMYVTLIAGAVTAVLDPVFIFVFELGIDGAAIVTVISRFVLLGIGLYGGDHHPQDGENSPSADIDDAAGPYFAIGLPAVMTQLATPVGNAYVTREIASFGDAAVAGWAMIGRLTPLPSARFLRFQVRLVRFLVKISVPDDLIACSRPCGTVLSC